MRNKITLLAAIAMIILPAIFCWKVQAQSAPSLAAPPGLTLVEIKMTGDEFVMLQNNTGADIVDLSSYWLYGFNKTNPLEPGVSSSSQQLPGGSLSIGQTILLSDGGPTCGAAVTASLSISLGDSAGYLEVVKTDLVNGLLTQTAGDAVSWSAGANQTPGMISGVPSNTKDPYGAWYRYKDLADNTYKWQPADISSNDACQLEVVVASQPVPGPRNPGSQLLPGLPPPATIVSFVAQTDTATGSLPPSDVGLRAPVLNELLPNPASPQTDSKDEFAEIYNPNDKSFDLSGFKLQVISGSSGSKHTYTFPNGTIIKPKGYAAYPSANISISLSNSGAQVQLLDPNDNVISKTETYGKAEDGFSWALANGKWYWSTTPTPGSANIINGLPTDQSASGGTGVGTVEGASTSAKPSTSTSSATNKSNYSPDSGGGLHIGVLAAVIAAALLYGLYEYRKDLGNLLYKLKRNRKFGRGNRTKP